MQRQQAALSAVEGETRALLQATKEARRQGFVKVQFESDSQTLVEVIRTKNDGFFNVVCLLFILLNLILCHVV
jgi:ribonuclease HI